MRNHASEWNREANRELRKEGLRLASFSESGWYHRVTVDGEPVSVWVTDL